MSFSITGYSWPAWQGRKPFIHQKHTVKFTLDYKRCFILNDMGTGKTLSALWTCDILLTAKKIRKVLIICPISTMKSVWFMEIALNMPHRKAIIAHGNAQVRLAGIKTLAHEFVIINHDGIKYVEDDIIAEQFDIIIIDELTAYKSHSAERSKAMKRIADKQKTRSTRLREGAVWGMTGEITPNAPTEAFFPCKIVNPDNQFLPRYYGQFRDATMYCVNDTVWIAKQEAPQIVAMCVQPAIRFTRDQCLDLPDTTYQTLEVPLSPEQTSYYNQMRSKAFLDTDSGKVTAVNAAVLLNKLCQISAGAVKNDNGDVIEIGCKERMDALIQIFEETPQKKLVVFATYRATIVMLEREFKRRGIDVASIHGDVNQNLRAKYIADFQTSTLQVLILQPQSSAHGITLTASSTVVWFSLLASNEYFQQGNARIIRAGQTRKTLIIIFVATKAEKHLAGILERKGDLSREVQKLFVDHDF